jgi:tetratricopeptide (TPR) repeat protein
MTDPDWFRNSQWTPEIEQQFEARLARSRGQRGEYLRIQALTLVETLRSECAAPAIALAQRHVELAPTGIGAAQMHAAIAQAFITLGRLEPAVDAFRNAVKSELARPNVRGCHYIDFAWFVATNSLSPHYNEALAAMQQIMQAQDLVLSANQYRYFGALALISADTGDIQNARRMAQSALSAASEERGPFWRLPGFGLVGRQRDVARSRLERLVG